MTRLFLRIYIGIVAALIVGAAATVYLLEQRVDAVRSEEAASRMLDVLVSVRDRFESHPEGERRDLDHGRLHIAVRGPDEIDADLYARLQVRDVIVESTEAGLQGWVLTSDGSVLVGSENRRWLVPGDRRPLPPEGRLRRGRGLRPGPGPLDVTGVRSGPLPDAGPWFPLLLLVVPLLLVGPAIFLLIRPVEKRVRVLSDVARQLGEGRLETRADVPAGDALSELASAFNGMADRIEELVAGRDELLRAVSHELRTPIARLFFVLDDAESAATEEDRRRQLAKIQAGLAEMNDLVEELLSFARLDSGAMAQQAERVHVPEVLESAAHVGRDLRNELRFDVVAATDPELWGNSRYIRRAVVNLVTNAARHARSRVRITAAAVPDGVEITVDDDGQGVPPAMRESVFEPFTRVDSARTSSIGGVGLGLAIVARIMKLHGGKATVDDSDLGGARFRLVFRRLHDVTTPVREADNQKGGRFV